MSAAAASDARQTGSAHGERSGRTGKPGNQASSDPRELFDPGILPQGAGVRAQGSDTSEAKATTYGLLPDAGDGRAGVPVMIDDFDPAALYEPTLSCIEPPDPLSEALARPGACAPARVSRRTSWHPAAGASSGYEDLYAALDLGTNNCRLLVAEPNRTSFRVIDAFSRIVRLGEGMSGSGRLSEAAQWRAIEALHVCRSKLEARGIRRARLVATEACRTAENGSEFIDRVEAETGLTLEVVTRETEARLAVAGCANLVDWQADGVVLFDIGGGSSELVWLDLTRERVGMDLTRHIRAWTSLPVGVVTLSER
ncbi:MAG: hypothetical protein P4L98_03975, partial [Ancalomicrobiaceae bacterium]|nr:hypothetical protein [Ancalomicrobiaceae bacterium]